MRRGEVYDAALDPTRDSEQAGFRPVVIVSRDVLHGALPIAIAVPGTTYQPGRRLYPSQVLLRAPDGGLSRDSVALCEQVRALAKSRLARLRGVLPPGSMAQIERALLIALDLLNPNSALQQGGGSNPQ